MTEHTDYISRADAIDAVAQEWLSEASAESPYVNDDDIGEYRKLAEELFEDVPSADAVQGEWIVREYCTNELDYRRWIEIECPFCGEKPTYEDLDNMNYCPNCGADMRKGGDDE